MITLEKLEKREVLNAAGLDVDYNDDLTIDNSDLVAWASDQGFTQDQIDWISAWREDWGTDVEPTPVDPPIPHGPHPYLPTDDFFSVHLHGGNMEMIPNFTKEFDTFTIADGNWNDPSVWSNGVPTTGEDVQIWNDIQVTSDVVVEDLTIWEGNLSFLNDTSLESKTITIMPDGIMTAEGTNIEVSFNGEVTDSGQFGVGLINMGVLRVNGGEVPEQLTTIATDVTVDTARGVTFKTADGSVDNGHIMVTSHYSVVDVRNAAFVNLGRTTVDVLNDTTNLVGRYSFHFHHGGDGSVFSNNVVTGTPKWGVTIHHTNDVQVLNNIIYNVGGSGIALEAGTETGNRIENNLIASVFGSGVTSPYARPDTDTGHHGDGIWTAAPENIYKNNTVYNVENAGWFMWDRKFNNKPFFIDGLEVHDAHSAVISHGGNRLGDGTANEIRNVTGTKIHEGIVINYGGKFNLTDIDINGDWQKGATGVIVGTHTYDTVLERVVMDRAWKIGAEFQHSNVDIIDSVFEGDWNDIYWS